MGTKLRYSNNFCGRLIFFKSKNGSILESQVATVQPKIVKKRYSEEGMFYHHSYSTPD